MQKIRNLIKTGNLSAEDLMHIVKLGADIAKTPEKYLDICHGKILGSLFFEPSTRTRLSFESAMLRLGGSVVTIPEPNVSSTTKGESLKDTIRTVGSYTDIIAMRHPHEGAGTLAAEVSPVPFINAGDGGHQHPTQTLTDLLTIYTSKGSLENHVIGLCGDLKFGRTVHSLVETMAKFKGNKFIFISPKELQIPDYLRLFLKENNLEYKEVESLDEVISELDILYMTRVQKERFFNEADYIRLKDSYILNMNKMEQAKKDMIVLHPLPRVNEIAEEVDNDPRAKYFNQVKNGMYVRMSLILHMLEER